MEETTVSTETTETPEVNNADYWPEDVSDIIADLEPDESDPETQAEAEDTEAKSDDGEGKASAEKGDGDNEVTTEPGEAEEKAPEEPEPETFTLKHLDDVRTVNREEVIALAQKGMDYDRIRSKYDDAAAELADIKNWFSKYQNGMDFDTFRLETDAQVLSKKEGIDLKTAKERIKLDNERKAFEAERSKAKTEQDTAEANRKRAEEDLREFQKKYPEITAKMVTDRNAIPQEVWDAVNKGERLVDAYDRYQAKTEKDGYENRIQELEKQIKELEQQKLEQKNAARSTGSQKTSGDDHFDLIDAGWNSV